MSKAKSSWQEIFNTFVLLVKDKRLRKVNGWAFCLLVFALLWLLNWKLVLATLVGIGLMFGCYLLQNPHWQRYCQKWQRFLVGSNRQLILSVSGGATGAFCTYLAASIWADADNQWLAIGAIVQGFVSLMTLALLVWSLWGKKAHNLETKLERLLADLSHSNHLRRLVAIRQLTRLVKTNRLDSEYYWQAIEYYRLMLSEPQLPVVKNALLESLNTLGREKVLKHRSPVKIPLKLQKVEKISNPERHVI